MGRISLSSLILLGTTLSPKLRFSLTRAKIKLSLQPNLRAMGYLIRPINNSKSHWISTTKTPKSAARGK